MTASIRILLAEDHNIVREGLKRLFDFEEDISVVTEARDGNEAIAAVKSCDTINLVVTDMSMPGPCGQELIGLIRAAKPQLPVLVLSMYNEIQYVRGALDAGASGYLTKDTDPEILLEAVRVIADGGSYIPEALAEQLVFNELDDRPPHTILSDREMQVFKLLALGASVNHVASQLSISNKTVSTHKARLMEKLGFANNTDLVRYAIRHQLIT